MNKKPYPRYKASGVPWLGEVPEHWEVKRIKYSASINDEALQESTGPEFEFLYVDIGSVDPVEGITKLESMVFEDAPSRARRKVSSGDTIVSTVRTYLRAIAAVPETDEPMIVSTGFAVVRPRKIKGGYLSFALREPSFVESVVARSVGVSYPAVNASEIGDISIPLPPDAEQTAIADFLDEQTGKIDHLIEKKRELIARLKEKRTALISRTVTRGLPPEIAQEFGLEPHTRFKDSGVEWLGEVPEGWDVKKFGHISFVVRGASPRPAGDPRYFDGDYMPWITVGEVTKDSGPYLSSTSTMLTEDGVSYSRVINQGTLVLTNSGATLGVPKILAVTGCANDGIVAFEKIGKDVNIFFLYYVLSSLTDNLRDRIKQGSGQPNLNTDIIKSLFSPLPSSEEQSAVVSYLDRETAKLDRLSEKVAEAIARLQEYRTALITAAVTGKIDVRH